MGNFFQLPFNKIDLFLVCGSMNLDLSFIVVINITQLLICFPQSFCFSRCGRWAALKFPKDIHVLILRTCDYVSVRSKMDFAGEVTDLAMAEVSQIIRVDP